MSNFTPGPWRISERAGRLGKPAIFAADNPMCIADLGIGMDDRSAANARLIAAAPEMFEALKAFMQLPHLFDDVCDKGTDCKVCKAILLGTDALAKAVQP